MRKTKSFLEYLDDIGWSNGVNGRNRITEGRVELPDDADTSGLFINTSNSKLNVNDRYYCIAPKDVVKLLASRKISGIREVEEGELEDIYTADEMNAFLLKKGVPAPIADMVAYDLWSARDPDTPVVVDPARYRIEIRDDEAFVENVVSVFQAVLGSSHSLSVLDGDIQVYATNGDGEYEWVWPSSMGVY